MAIITISTSEELDSFMRGTLGSSGDFFNLTADINMTGYSYMNGPFYSGFTGIFDGGNYVIDNLTIDGSDDFTGFFPQLTGTLRSITFQYISITNHSVNTNTGTGIAGFFGSGGMILNVNVMGNSLITASCQRIGAVAGNIFGGQFSGTILVGNETQAPTVTGSQIFAGGLAGFWGDGLLNCDAINYAIVSSVNAEAQFVGGIAGAIQSVPFVAGSRLINHGPVSGSAYVGRLFGNYSVIHSNSLFHQVLCPAHKPLTHIGLMLRIYGC